MNSELILPLLLALLAFAGFSIIVWRFYSLHTSTFDFNTESEFAPSSLGPIAYRKIGEHGSWLVFVHGLGASSYCWRKVAPAFAETHRILLFDLPGFGESTKDFATPLNLDLMASSIGEILKYHKIKKATFVAHSMGAQITVHWAEQNPQGVEQLFLITPAIHPQVVPRLFRKAGWMAHWTPALINKSFIKTLLKRVVNSQFDLTDEIIEAYFRPYRDPITHRRFAEAVEMLMDPRPYNHLEKLQAPTTLIWGTKDRVVHPRLVQDMIRKIKHVQAVALARSNHLPLEDDFERLIVEIKRRLLIF